MASSSARTSGSCCRGVPASREAPPRSAGGAAVAGCVIVPLWSCRPATPRRVSCAAIGGEAYADRSMAAGCCCCGGGNMRSQCAPSARAKRARSESRRRVPARGGSRAPPPPPRASAAARWASSRRWARCRSSRGRRGSTARSACPYPRAAAGRRGSRAAAAPAPPSRTRPPARRRRTGAG
eukprot:5699622-Prymnesium_polylepis.1